MTHTFSLRAFTSISRSFNRAFFRSLELWAATLFFIFLKFKIIGILFLQIILCINLVSDPCIYKHVILGIFAVTGKQINSMSMKLLGIIGVYRGLVGGPEGKKPMGRLGVGGRITLRRTLGR
jgi:hypothetical protein